MAGVCYRVERFCRWSSGSCPPFFAALLAGFARDPHCSSGGERGFTQVFPQSAGPGHVEDQRARLPIGGREIFARSATAHHKSNPVAKESHFPKVKKFAHPKAG